MNICLGLIKERLDRLTEDEIINEERLVGQVLHKILENRKYVKRISQGDLTGDSDTEKIFAIYNYGVDNILADQTISQKDRDYLEDLFKEFHLLGNNVQQRVGTPKKNFESAEKLYNTLSVYYYGDDYDGGVHAKARTLRETEHPSKPVRVTVQVYDKGNDGKDK